MDLLKMKEAMAQATKMQEQMERSMAETFVEASSGGGMVTVRMNGQKMIQKLTIDPAVVTGSGPSEIEMLEDLVTAAVNEAARKADDAMKSNVKGLLGGLNIPGL
jgi:DNA-binding YbaB/EbfC family protein